MLFSDQLLGLNIIGLYIYCFIFAISRHAEAKDVKFGYTEHEKQLIPKFRMLVESGVIEQYMLHDSYLVRWIRSTNYDLEKAKGNFLNHVQWKKEIKNSNYLDDLEHLNKLFPYRIFQSKDGRPVIFGHFGQWEIRKAELTSKIKNPFTRNLIKALDDVSFEIIEQSNKGHTNVTNGIDLFDLAGYTLRNQACAACLTDIVKGVEIIETQYPRLFGDVVFVNTPRIFETVLNLIKSVLGEYYREAIKVYGLNKAEWEISVTNLLGHNI